MTTSLTRVIHLANTESDSISYFYRVFLLVSFGRLITEIQSRACDKIETLNCERRPFSRIGRLKFLDSLHTLHRSGSTRCPIQTHTMETIIEMRYSVICFQCFIQFANRPPSRLSGLMARPVEQEYDSISARRTSL